MRGCLAGIYCGKVGKFWPFVFPLKASLTTFLRFTYYLELDRSSGLYANEVYILCVHLWTHLVRNVLRMLGKASFTAQCVQDGRVLGNFHYFRASIVEDLKHHFDSHAIAGVKMISFLRGDCSDSSSNSSTPSRASESSDPPPPSRARPSATPHGQARPSATLHGHARPPAPPRTPTPPRPWTTCLVELIQKMTSPRRGRFSTTMMLEGRRTLTRTSSPSSPPLTTTAGLMCVQSTGRSLIIAALLLTIGIFQKGLDHAAKDVEEPSVYASTTITVINNFKCFFH